MEIDEEKEKLKSELNNERREKKQLLNRLSTIEQDKEAKLHYIVKRVKNELLEQYKEDKEIMQDLKKNQEKSQTEYYDNIAKQLNNIEENLENNVSKTIKELYGDNKKINDIVEKGSSNTVKNSVGNTKSDNGDIFYNGYKEQRFNSAINNYTERTWQKLLLNSDYVVRTNQGLRIGQVYYKNPLIKRAVCFSLQGAFAPVKFNITFPYQTEEEDGVEFEEDKKEEIKQDNSLLNRIKNVLNKKQNNITDDTDNISTEDNFINETNKNSIETIINNNYFNLWNNCLEQIEVFGGGFIAITDDNDIIYGNRWEISIDAEDNNFLFNRTIDNNYKDYEQEEKKALFFNEDGSDRIIKVKDHEIKYKNLFLLKTQYHVNPFFNGLLGGWGASYLEDKIKYCWGVEALEKSNVEQLQNQVKVIFKKNQMNINRALQTSRQLKAEYQGYNELSNSGVMDNVVIDGNDNIELLKADYDPAGTIDEIYREIGSPIGIPKSVFSGEQESGALIATVDDNIIDSMNLRFETLRNCYFNQLFNCLKLIMFNEFDKLNIKEKQFIGELQYSNKGVDSVSTTKKVEKLEKVLSMISVLENSVSERQPPELADIKNKIVKNIQDLLEK